MGDKMKTRKWVIRIIIAAAAVFLVLNIIWGVYYFRVKKIYDMQMEKCGVDSANIGGYFYFTNMPAYLKFNGSCGCVETIDADKLSDQIDELVFVREIWVFFPAFGSPVVASELKEYGNKTLMDGSNKTMCVHRSYTEWNEQMELKTGDGSTWKRAEPYYKEVIQNCHDMWGFFGEYLGE